MRLTPKSELEHRCLMLQRAMDGAGLDAVIIVQNADLFYFTGTVQSGVLYLPREGEPIYMVRKDHARARMECGLREVVPISSLKDSSGDARFLRLYRHRSGSGWSWTWCR